jgi:hypothetical protein
MLQRIILKELYRNSPLRRIDLAWIVATKYPVEMPYLKLERVVKVYTPKHIALTPENLVKWMRNIKIVHPKLPNSFSSSLSRSLKSLRRRKLIKIYKEAQYMISITKYGRKVVEQYLLDSVT